VQQAVWEREASETALIEGTTRLTQELLDRDNVIALLGEEVRKREDDATALRNNLGERTSLWHLLRAEVSELQHHIKEREAAGVSACVRAFVRIHIRCIHIFSFYPS
jgi:hypothetical protein